MADLGFLLTRPPQASPGAHSFYLLARAALDQGHAVRAFFYQDGVYQCLKAQDEGDGEGGPSQWLEALVEAGASLVASHACLKGRGLDSSALVPGVRMGTLEELALTASRADRVVCL